MSMSYQQPPFPPSGQPMPYPQPGAAPYAGPPAPYAAPSPYPAPPAYPAAPSPYAVPSPYSAAPQPGRPAADPLSGFDQADPTGSRLPHFNADRRYTLENTRVEFFQGRNDDFITLEFNVLESDDPMLGAGRQGKYMIKMGQDMSLPNFKSVLGALLGYGTKDEIVQHVTQDVARAALAESQPNRSKRVLLTTTSTTTKQGKPFTVHNWSPASSAVAAPVFAAPAQAFSAPAAPPAAAAPPVPPAVPPAAAAVFPPAGWYVHPGQPGAFHNGKEIVSEAELRSRQSQGRA